MTAPTHRTSMRDAMVLATLLVTVCGIAIVMVLAQRASVLEAVSFVTGALCVWLTVKQNIWNFPIGLINVGTFCVVFFQSRLYADAGLQIVYFAMGLMGWYLWLRGGEDRTRLKVVRASYMELACLLVFTTAATIALWQMLQHVGGTASFWDALTTSLSLASQWLINRKRLESWIGWIIVDAIYVPLYINKELYLTALLYSIFLVMAIMGLAAWHSSWLAGRATSARQPLLRAEVP